jgi:drug/metabolite transporter (DMT)-like permease
MWEKFRVHLALIAVGLIYGANYAIAKGIMPIYLPPLGFVLIRVIFGTFLFSVYLLFSGKNKVKIKFSRKDHFNLIKAAFFGIALNQICFFKGLSLTSPINASLLMTTTPILVLIFVFINKSEKVTWKKWVGILMGLTGAILLIVEEEISLDNGLFIGDLFIFVNALSFGYYLVMAKPLMSKFGAVRVSAWMFFYGFFMVLPFSWQEFLHIDFYIIPAWAWLSVLYVIIFTTFLAYLLNSWTLKHADSSLVSIYIYLQPVIASAIAILLGQDQLEFQKVLLAGLIFTGVFLVSKR